MTDIEEIKNRLKDIELLLRGNGKVGVAEMSRRSFEHMTQGKASKNGFLDWGFRIVILGILAYILRELGVR